MEGRWHELPVGPAIPVDEKRPPRLGKDAVPARGHACAGSRVFVLGCFDPGSGHATDFVETSCGMKELLGADPFPRVDNAPEHAQFFHDQV